MAYPINTRHIPIFIFLLFLPASLFGQETKANPSIPVAAEGSYVFTVEHGRLSLQAQEASLQNILEEIGQKMRIEVVGEITPQEIITAEFHNLPLEQALHRLSPNYGYQMGSESGDTTITKIFVLPNGGLKDMPLIQKETVEIQNTKIVPMAEEQLKPVMTENFKGSDKEKAPPISSFNSFKFEFDPTQ